jgi:large subunit ribosomal protein L20
MTRVKRGTTAHKKRESVLKKTKGFRWGRKSKERAAKEALLHAQSRMFRGRKENKRNYRALWQTQINAASRNNQTTYGNFIFSLKKNKIELDRKILAKIASEHPQVFEEIVKSVK